MRALVLIMLAVLLATSDASYGKHGSGNRLRLAHQTDGHGNTVFALEINPKKRYDCDVEGAPIANYLRENGKTGETRWLFPRPQRCIWRVFSFAERPQQSPVDPAAAKVIVYDVTPSGELAEDWMGGFRFCTGINPCLPLRRLFVSRADGSDLAPLTPSFQIFDPDIGPPSITQRQDGVVVVSFQDYPHRPSAEFSVSEFRVLKTWQPEPWHGARR